MLLEKEKGGEGEGDECQIRRKKGKADQVFNENIALHHFYHYSAFQSSLKPVYATVKKQGSWCCSKRCLSYPQSLLSSVSGSRPQPKSMGFWQAGLLHGDRPSPTFLPLCTHSPALASSHGHFSMVATCLWSDVCHLQAPKQMGTQGEKHEHEQNHTFKRERCF